MSTTTEPEIQYYHHGRFRVAGGILPDAITAFQTYGSPENPCIVFPTCYGGKLDNTGLLGQTYMIGEDKALQPSKYYIVTFALFSNGESSSPSNTPAPHNGPYFPAVSYFDNIRAQHIVLTKVLGVKKVYAVIGFSMGAQQAYYWPVVYPDFVDRFICLCGSARTSPHNKCFLEGPKAALAASKDFDDGHYTSVPQIGVRAFGRAYSAWAYGQTWFRQHGYLHDGRYCDLDSFLREEWEAGFLNGWDANDLLCLLKTWQDGDCSLVHHGGDYEKCLSEVKAKGLIMPSKTDLYFPPEDSEREVSLLPNAKLVVIESVWGHMAGGGSNDVDDEFIKKEVLEFLQDAGSLLFPSSYRPLKTAEFAGAVVPIPKAILRIEVEHMVTWEAYGRSNLTYTSRYKGTNHRIEKFLVKMAENQTQYYEHGRFKVAGGVLPNAITAYRTYGDPTNPCIVFPTCYGAKMALGSQDYWVGEDKPLDPSKYYIVTFALFCNGESSSPSNTPAPHNGPYFPAISYQDNIRAQYAVLTNKLGVNSLHCVVGFSMGGQQAYHWATMYPDFVQRFIAVCSSARTSPHNKCFLEGPKAALSASKDFNDGHYSSPPQHGIRAFARVYSAWAYGQAWFREHNYLANGLYPDLNSWLREAWEGRYVTFWDANDMLALLNTWQTGDISLVRDNGDLEKALKSIKAKGLIMPSKTDLYFPPEDSQNEITHLKDARLVVIPSVWGHVAGGGANPVDVAFTSARIKEFLEEK